MRLNLAGYDASNMVSVSLPTKQSCSSLKSIDPCESRTTEYASSNPES